MFSFFAALRIFKSCKNNEEQPFFSIRTPGSLAELTPMGALEKE
jgi:hypothetical protein